MTRLLALLAKEELSCRRRPVNECESAADYAVAKLYPSGTPAAYAGGSLKGAPRKNSSACSTSLNARGVTVCPYAMRDDKHGAVATTEDPLIAGEKAEAEKSE